MDYVNKETGEVFEPIGGSPFRSLTDLKGFKDHEKAVGESVTDPTGYEPIEKIVERMSRGDLLAEFIERQKASQYDVKAGSDENAFLDNPPPVMDDIAEMPTEFEMAQASSLVQSQGKATEPNAETPHIVANSDPEALSETSKEEEAL